MSLPHYPRYKDSGALWIGDVPAHWTLLKVKAFTEFCGGGTPSRDNLAFWNGDIPWISPKDVKSERITRAEECITNEGLLSSSSSMVEAGRLLMVVRSGILKHTIPVAINDVPVALNQDMKALRFSQQLATSDFFLRWVQGLNDALLLAWAKQGATVESIEHDYLAETLVPLPSLAEQHAITAFLDRETAKIDALIAEQEKLLALLAEKRQAIISHVVTRGLNPDAPMKDSGTPWLGEVPAHWEVIPLKHLCSLLKDGTHLPPPRVDEGVPLLSVRNIDESVFAFREDDSMISTSDYLELCRAFVPRSGDVLMAIVGATLGKAAVVPHGMGDFHIQRSLAIFRPKLQLLGEWLFQCITSGSFQRLIWENVGFSAQPGIYLGTLGNFKFPVPPLGEQKNIVRFLTTENRKLDALKADTERAISLLKDRRSALISAAVTGKIDVRHAA